MTEPLHNIEAEQQPLHNIEAEQQLLGSILLNNDAYDRVSGLVTAREFFDPVHARIFAVIGERVRRSEVASPVSLKPYFAEDPGLRELGGVVYLARLAGASVSLDAVWSHARTVADMARRRDLLAVLEEGIAKVHDLDAPAGAAVATVETWSLGQEARNDAQIVSMLDATVEAVRQMNAAVQDGVPPGIPSGIAALDDIIGGLCPGQMIVIAGRPGMGKSAVALQIATNVARGGIGVAFGSLEMTEVQLAQRALAEQVAVAGGMVTYHDIRTGALDEREHEQVIRASTSVGDLLIKLLPADARSPGAILGATRRVAKLFERTGQQLGLLVLDYLQIMEASSRGNGNERVTELSNASKAIARKLGIPVLVLSQLSRGVEQRNDKRPMLSDLRESGAIEQDADVVIFPFRESYYIERDRPDEKDAGAMQDWRETIASVAGWIDLIVAKNRMGPLGGARCLFDERTNWLRDSPNYQGRRARRSHAEDFRLGQAGEVTT